MVPPFLHRLSNLRPPRRWLRRLLPSILGLGLVAGCSRSPEQADAPPPRNPKEAATAIEQVFEQAPGENRQAAASAAEALRGGDYEKAVVHLEAMKLRENITVEQGLAIHQSIVAMEAKLVQAMEAGDPNARRAYETLKRMKRK
jgi:hypothetical protein